MYSTIKGAYTFCVKTIVSWVHDTVIATIIIPNDVLPVNRGCRSWIFVTWCSTTVRRMPAVVHWRHPCISAFALRLPFPPPLMTFHCFVSRPLHTVPKRFLHMRMMYVCRGGLQYPSYQQPPRDVPMSHQSTQIIERTGFWNSSHIIM